MSEQLQLFSPAVTCTACGKPIYHPHYETRHTGRSTVQLPFCSKPEANEWYLHQLRKAGQ